MNYDKPKVFIDLEEYNMLLSKSNESESQNEILIYKEVVASLLNNKFDTKGTVADLRLKNIGLSVLNNGFGKITAEEVTVKKING